MLGWGLTVHLRIRRHWASVRVVPRHGEPVQVEGMARVVLRRLPNGAEEVVAVGEAAGAYAGAGGVIVRDAFCHPRVLIGGFDEAASVVGEFLRRACGGRRPLLRFAMVVEVLEALEGGLADVEDRALQELGLRLGASQVRVSQGLPQPEPGEGQAVAGG